MGDEGDHTKDRHLRVTGPLWTAYGDVSHRVFGMDRTPHLVDLREAHRSPVRDRRGEGSA